MDDSREYLNIAKDEYDELLQKLKAVELEKNKLARELRAITKRGDINKLNIETQTALNKIITGEKQKQEMYVRLLLESCPVSIFIFDENIEFLLGTQSITEVIGVGDIAILQGRGLDSIVERYRPPAFTEEIIASLKDVAVSHDNCNKGKKLEISAEDKKYEVNILPFHKENGDFAGILLIMHDVSDIIRSKEIAEQASKAKGDFLSNMSHEMRTPMNAIIGMTVIGKKTDDIEQKNHALNKIGDASSHLLGVINDVLDMAKIEADKLELAPIEYSFEKMLQKVITVINFRVHEKHQRLFVNIDGNVPRFVVGDDQRLAQVVTNLLSNAVKFTPEGGEISLNASLVGESGENCELQIEVADNGIGISPEQQKKLFFAFEQAETGTSRQYGGTGLGLVISKRIIELMDGRIWMESELGKGARFIFTVKALRGQKTPRSLLDPGVNWETVRILTVDDMIETRIQFQSLFDNLNIKCDVASDGFEACRIIEERGGYDIYFIDYLMPGMDGIELTRQIKSRWKDKSSVVTMITAMDWGLIKDDAISAGVGKYLLKPLFSSTIIDCINECLEISYTKESGPSSAGEFEGKRLLLAEDVEINREILIALLEETGLAIDCAENGKVALEMIETDPEKFDMVFMDIQMPKMDGLEAARRIRALPACGRERLPIVAMTANVFKDDIEACLAAGMDDHLGKPLDIDRVFDKLRKYLRTRS